MKLKSGIILVLMATMLASCIKERELKYDTSLLSDLVFNDELHIAYQVPAGYKVVSQSFTDSIAKLEQEADPFAEKRISVYVDTLLGNANICLYDMRSLPYERTEDRLDLYKGAYNANNQWESIEKGVFKHGDFDKIVELTMINASTDRRLQKYYFYEDGKAQFSVDYYFRNNYYNDLKPYIDASLASFHKDIRISIEVESIPN